MPDDLGDEEEFEWIDTFNFIACVSTDRSRSIEARIDAALMSGVYRPKPGSQQLSS
jgi:hypothetical protein